MAHPTDDRVIEIIRVELARKDLTQAALARHLFGGYDSRIAKRMSHRMRGRTAFSDEELDAVGDFLGTPIELLLAAS